MKSPNTRWNRQRRAARQKGNKDAADQHDNFRKQFCLGCINTLDTAPAPGEEPGFDPDRRSFVGSADCFLNCSASSCCICRPRRMVSYFSLVQLAGEHTLNPRLLCGIVSSGFSCRQGHGRVPRRVLLGCKPNGDLSLVS